VSGSHFEEVENPFADAPELEEHAFETEGVGQQS
jgi:hypothetical protein